MKPSTSSIGAFTFTAIAAMLFGTPVAWSATYTWNSTATGINWTDASNWGGAVPGSGDIGLFSAAFYSSQPSLSGTAGAAIGGIWDTGSGSLTIGGASSLALFGTMISSNTGAGIELDSGTGQLTINCPMFLPNSQQWINNSTNPLVVGNVSGSTLTCTGSGAQFLDGTDSFSGALSVASGTLSLGSNVGALSAPNEYIGTSGSAAVVQTKGVNSVTSTANLSGLLLGYASSSQGYYTLSSGSVSAANEYIGYSGSGTFTQSGGTNSLKSLWIASVAGGSGTYSLNGGLLSAIPSPGSGFEYVGSGTFTQSGGTNLVSNFLKIDGGNYSLSGNGLLSATSSAISTFEYIGYSGSGSFTQTGGTNTSSGYLWLGTNPGSNGTYNLGGGGLLSVNTEQIGVFGTGSFTQANATNLVAGLYLGSDGSASRGTYNLNSGGNLSATEEFVGNTGNGVFAQSGGTNAVSGILGIALLGSGTYSLSGGQLSAGSECVAYQAASYQSTGVFNQSSGMNSTGSLILATSPENVGIYNLSGGTTSASNEIIGLSGSGSFTQSGGTNLAGGLVLTQFASGYGAYNLNSGLLLIGSGGITQGSGTAALNFGGGTLGASAPWSSAVIMTLTGSGGNATVDTTGGSIALSGNLTGSSTLSKVGPGVLTLSGTNSNIGGLIVDGGTLQMPGGSLASPTQYVGYAGSGSFAQSGGTNVAANYLGIGYNAGSSGSYSLSSNGLLTAANESIGASGVASFTQSGGTHAVSGELDVGGLFNGSGGSGSYNLNGSGQLTVATEIVGTYSGTGSFTQSGGTHAVSNILYVGEFGNGTYQLGPTGFLTTPYELIGQYGTGSFTQTGGTNSVPIYIQMGVFPFSSGSYGLSGGLLATGGEYVGTDGSGTFMQSGGTNSLSAGLEIGANAGGSGSYILSASGLLTTPSELIGFYGSNAYGSPLAASGSFTQSGGTNTVSGELALGYNAGGSGSFYLAGSTVAPVLTAATEYVGLSGTGSFNQTGGSHTVSNTFYVGYNSGGSGTYSLSGGVLVAPSEYIGYSGSGSFTQSGGTNSTGSLILAQTTGSYGLYNLNGGLLLIGSAGITRGLGTAAFNFGGGTLGTATAGSSSINMTLTGSGGNATIDTTGGNIVLSGILSGSGGLNKVGPGTLTLSSPNTFGGGASILAGTLLLASSNAVENSTVNVLVDNGLQFLPGIDTFNLGGVSGGNVLTLSDTGGSALTLTAGGDGASTTYSGNIGGNGGLVKAGSGVLTLSGSNGFSGGSTISGGALAFGATVSVPNLGTITIGPNGALVATPIYNPAAPVSSWLASGRIAANPTGAIALPNGAIDNESISLSATSSGLSLGAIGSATYGGALTTVASTVYLGGGGTLVFSSNLSTSGGLAVGTRGVPGGSVILTGSNSLGGSLVVDGGMLQMPSGTLAASAEYIGYSGTGTFNQTGGTNTIATALYLGQNPGSVGSYNLVGGLLVVANILPGAGGGSLNVTGGSLTAATGAITVATPVVLTTSSSSGTFNTTNSSLTIAGQISGAGGLTKTGTAALVLAAANTYTGGTTVAQGTLLLTNSNAAQNTAINIAVDNGLQFGAGIGTFNVGALGGAGDLVLADTAGGAITAVAGGNGATTIYTGEITGAGALVHTGTGALLLTASNGFSGGLTIGAGTVGSVYPLPGLITFTNDPVLQAAAASFSIPGNVTISASATGVIDTNGFSVPVGGSISGAGGLTKTGAGTLILANSNSISGPTAIDQGTLELGNSAALQNSTVSVNANNGLAFGSNISNFSLGGLSGLGGLSLTDSSGTPINVTLGSNNQDTTYSGTISGGGTLTKAGTGSLDLTGSNSQWTGGLNFDPGVVAFNSDAALGGPANPIVFLGSGTLQIRGAASVTFSAGRLITINSGATAALDPGGGTLTVGGPIGGQGALAVCGNGTVVLANSNNYAGGSSVTAGALEATTTAALPGAFTPGKVRIAGGATLVLAAGGPQQWTAAGVNLLLSVSGLFSPGASFGLDTSGGSFDIGSINSHGIALAIADGDSLAVGGSGVSTFSGRITGGGSLSKLGPGTLVLSPGATGNDYSGGTQVLDGTLVIASPAALGDGTDLSLGDLSYFAAVVPNAAVDDPRCGCPGSGLNETAAASPAISLAAVPEPSALALLAAAVLFSVLIACVRSMRQGINNL